MSTAIGEIEVLQDRVRSESNPNSKYLQDSGEKQLVLDITAKSSFASVRANTAVSKECFYYEVTLLSDGLM